jgi:PadR family transcriptional regulator
VRRRRGALVPLERAVLEAGLRLRARGAAEFYGYALARELRRAPGAPRPAGSSAVYKALGRLARADLLRRRWEAPEPAERARRPRRRLYAVTPAGAAAATECASATPLPTDPT